MVQQLPILLLREMVIDELPGRGEEKMRIECAVEFPVVPDVSRTPGTVYEPPPAIDADGVP
jgi:hypothetical protein